MAGWTREYEIPVRVYLNPFRLGLRTFRYGIILKYRGLWRGYGPE